MWHSNDMFHYMIKAEFVTLESLKVPSGYCIQYIPTYLQCTYYALASQTKETQRKKNMVKKGNCNVCRKKRVLHVYSTQYVVPSF